MEQFIPGSNTVISLQLADGATDQYPRAVVRVSSSEVVEATIDLEHVSGGLYAGSWVSATDGPYQVTYIVYSDANHTIVNEDYLLLTENWNSGGITTNELPVIM